MSKKRKEELPDFIRRLLKEKGLSTRDVEERAKRKGKKITHGYISRIVSRTVTNPSVDKLKALAAGLGVREKEIFDYLHNDPLENNAAYQESGFAFLYEKYKDLTDKDKMELSIFITIIDHEIERRLGRH